MKYFRTATRNARNFLGLLYGLCYPFWKQLFTSGSCFARRLSWLQPNLQCHFCRGI